MEYKEYKSFLIIKMSSLGDIVHALPTLVAIRKNWPNAKIMWAVHEQYVEFLPMKPYIDEVIIVDRKRLFSFSYMVELRRKFKEHHFDVVIDLQALLKSNIILALCGSGIHYSYCEQKEGNRFFAKPLIGPNKDGNIIERYLDVVRVLGGTVDQVEFPPLPIDKERFTYGDILEGIGVYGKYVVFAVATRWVNKNLPPAYFAEVADYLGTLPVDVVLIGSPADEAIGREIMESTTKDNVYNLIGKTSIKEMCAIIEGSQLFIGGDTGPMHIANACGVPLIALFGATYPSRSGPYGNDRSHVLLSSTAPEEKGQRANKMVTVMAGLKPSLVVDEIAHMMAHGDVDFT